MTYLKQKPGSIEDVIAKQQSPYQESSYQDKFKKELDKAGRGIGSMSPKEKSAFFDKVDDIKKTKQESYQDDDNYSSALNYVLKKYGYDDRSNNAFMQRARKKVGRVVGFQDVINQLKKEKEPGWQSKIAKMEREVKEKDRQFSKKDPANRTISRFNKKSYEQLSKEEFVQTEALTPEKQKEHDKLMKDFIAKGGKVQKIPVGKKNFQGNKLIVRAGAKKSLAAEHNPAELNEVKYAYEFKISSDSGNDGSVIPQDGTVNASSEKDAENKAEKLGMAYAKKINKQKSSVGRPGRFELEDVSVYKEQFGANTTSNKNRYIKYLKKTGQKLYKKNENDPSKTDNIEEGTSELVKKAVEIAKKMANNYTGATNAIEALKKGLSKNPTVSAALLAANENFVKENVGHQLWGKAVSDTENRGDSKLLPSKNIQQEADEKDEKDDKGASTSKVPVISKDNKPGVKIAKIRLKRDKMDGAEGSGTKDPAAQEKQILTLTGQINVLKAKLENEKHKIMKPVANKVTGQVPLTVGIASKLLRDKAEKENDEDKKEVKKESVSPYKLKYETLRARLKEKAEKEKLAKKKNEPTKGRTMTGEPASKIDTKPEISYTM